MRRFLLLCCLLAGRLSEGPVDFGYEFLGDADLSFDALGEPGQALA